MDCIVYGVAKSQTRMSDFHFHFQGLYTKYVKCFKNLFFTISSKSDAVTAVWQLLSSYSLLVMQGGS